MSATAKRRHTRHVPWVWCRIVRACSALTAMEKLVYDEVRGLATGKGATIGAGPLGLRLGVSRETIERARRRLLEVGLVSKVDLGRGRAAAWFPELPTECAPPSRTRRLADDDVQAYADKLTERITLQNRRESGVADDATEAP